MNRTQEQKLAALAREAGELRRTINAAESMLRSWARRQKTPSATPDGDVINLYLSDRRVGRWHASVDLPAAQVERQFMPILREIKKAASEKLQALKADIWDNGHE